MSVPVSLILAGAAGMAFGLLYFGGLWLTVRWLPRTRFPAMLTLSSLLGRMAVTLAGFYVVMAGRSERLLACVAGFVLMRFVVVSWLQTHDVQPELPRSEKEMQ